MEIKGRGPRLQRNSTGVSDNFLYRRPWPSGDLVGTLLLFSKIFDGVTDLFAGYIVDNTRTRFGKGRPYELSILGVWLMTIIMFFCPPSMSTAVKAVWVFITYTFINSIFTTL